MHWNTMQIQCNAVSAGECNTIQIQCSRVSKYNALQYFIIQFYRGPNAVSGGRGNAGLIYEWSATARRPPVRPSFTVCFLLLLLLLLPLLYHHFVIMKKMKKMKNLIYEWSATARRPSVQALLFLLSLLSSSSSSSAVSSFCHHFCC